MNDLEKQKMKDTLRSSLALWRPIFYAKDRVTEEEWNTQLDYMVSLAEKYAETVRKETLEKGVLKFRSRCTGCGLWANVKVPVKKLFIGSIKELSNPVAETG